MEESLRGSSRVKVSFRLFSLILVVGFLLGVVYAKQRGFKIEASENCVEKKK